MRILCWPSRSPRSGSRRLPGGIRSELNITQDVFRAGSPCLLKESALAFNAALNRLLQYIVTSAEQGEGFPGPGHGGIDQFAGEYRGEGVRHDQGGVHEFRAL